MHDIIAAALHADEVGIRLVMLAGDNAIDRRVKGQVNDLIAGGVFEVLLNDHVRTPL